MQNKPNKYSNIKKTLIPTSLTALSATLLSLNTGCVPLAVVATPAVVASSNSISTNIPANTQVNDFKIKFHILHIIQSDPELKNKSNIDAAVFNNVVLLLGQVPNKAVKKQLSEKISKLKYVRVIYDELTVGPIISISTYANDAWISTKVKSRFVGSVNPTHFKVITQKGIVYLMGVTTKEEGALAAKLASQTTDVKKVIEIFAYIPSSKTTENLKTQA